jgi:hypothetical protein
MKKVALVMFTLLLIILSHVRDAYAVSCGYQRYKDDECEVYIEFFPIVPFDPAYPTASEEFAFKYYVYQKDWWYFIAVHVVPAGFYVLVYFRDDTCGENSYPTFKRWYPTSTSQHGLHVTWSLSGGYGPLSITAILSTVDSSFSTNYTKYPVDSPYGEFMHLSDLLVEYHYNWFWGSTYTEGAGSIGIPNDLAQPHEGHHVLVAVLFRLVWYDYGIGYLYKDIVFYLGNDEPADTDCWLTVERGNTNFLETRPASGGEGGGGGCPTLFVWNGTDYAEEGILNIHAESDITVQHQIQNALVLENGVYKLQLKELDNYTSHIDQVKLYAVDYQGIWHTCPLTYAYHNELGKVTSKLFFDDSKRVDLEPTEIINLKFAPSIPPSQTAYFIFEINGYNMKWMGE